MEKTIYLIRHSGPFVEIANYDDYESISWKEYNRNMILSVAGEDNARKLYNLDELKDINEIYASNSFRAIGTAKYLSSSNNIKIKLDKRIDERDFGVNYITELPNNFNKLSFDDKNFKVKNGESLNEVDNRFKAFINEILDNDSKKIVIVLHGIILLSYLETICSEFLFDGKIFKIIYEDNLILNGNPKNPSVYKITYDDCKAVSNVMFLECN